MSADRLLNTVCNNDSSAIDFKNCIISIFIRFLFFMEQMPHSISQIEDQNEGINQNQCYLLEQRALFETMVSNFARTKSDDFDDYR